jgi:glycosyltransferase involved in cell wall biosynthesis
MLPIQMTAPRPFWSVMVPTYNPRADYLEETLRSILQQDPGPGQMQIEVVDDCSPDVDVEKIVSSLANGRIIFSKTPKNLGLGGCWNTCIERAKGEWVHILHQDDIVLSGFYSSLHKGAIDKRVGAMFARHATINPAGHWLFISELHRESPGILENWHEQITVQQLIQCPAIVIRRSVYEELGGFLVELSFTLDWEMWQRIAANYSFWFEPAILVNFRVHPGSTTSRLRLVGADTREVRKTIEMTAAYHPHDRAQKLARKARHNSAGFAAFQARELLVRGHSGSAWKQMVEALRLSRNWHMITQFFSFLTLRAKISGAQLRRRARHHNHKAS